MASASFQGFPKEGFDFLRDLRKNNDREWFKEHKQEYLDHLVVPTVAFVEAFGKKLHGLSKDLVYDTRTNGHGSLMRIYRDTRFSKDKSPYHTHHRIAFWSGSGKRMAAPGYFVWFDAEEWGMVGGHHMFSKPTLRSYRDAVLDSGAGKKLEAVLSALRKGGYEVGEPEYKRVPRGFDAEHPRASLLRQKGVWAGVDRNGVSVLREPEFVDECFRHSAAMAPLVQWLSGLKGWGGD